MQDWYHCVCSSAQLGNRQAPSGASKVPQRVGALTTRLQNQQMLTQCTRLLLVRRRESPPLLSCRARQLLVPPLLGGAWLLLPVCKGHGPLLLLLRVAAIHRQAWG